MNERIVKLISEADAYAWTIVDKYAPDCGQVSYLWEDAFRKKFAELIVRECMSVARGMRNPPNLNYKPSDRFVDELQLHFGVKE